MDSYRTERAKKAAALADKENGSSSSARPHLPQITKSRSKLSITQSPVKARRPALVAKQSFASPISLRTESSNLKPAKRASKLAASFIAVEVPVRGEGKPLKSPLSSRAVQDRIVSRQPTAVQPQSAIYEDHSREATLSSASVKRCTVTTKLGGTDRLKTKRQPSLAQDVITLSDDEEVEDDPGGKMNVLSRFQDTENGSDVEIVEERSIRRDNIDLSRHKCSDQLRSLLRESGNLAAQAYDFTSFVSHPPSPLQSATATRHRQPVWTKIGEASYSEVFKCGDTVVKIIPVTAAAAADVDETDMPYMSDLESVGKEIRLSRLLGGEQALDGFVRFRGAFIVQGAYPGELLDSWDEFKIAQRPPCEDQIRPDVLPHDQVYALICLADAGSDLESFRLRDWREAASVLRQVVRTCAEAETAIQFEHRDLHWGNILIERKSESLGDRLARLDLDQSSAAEELNVTLIDFTLSRATSERRHVIFDAFEDECIFEGEGDEQFEVYRRMRNYVNGDWEGYHPRTNVMWIHYLANKLLKAKKLKRPPSLADSRPTPSSPASRSSRTTRHSMSAFSATDNPSDSARRARTLPAKMTTQRGKAAGTDPAAAERRAYEQLVAAEELIRIALQLGQPPKKGRGRKATAMKSGVEEQLASAGDILAWMNANAW